MNLSIFLQYFKYLRYLPMLMRVLKDYEGILQAMVKGPNHIPSQDEIHLALEDLKEVLASGIIALPDVEEEEIENVLQSIENQLAGAAMDAMKNLVKYGDVKSRADGSMPQVVSGVMPVQAVDPVHAANVTAPDPSKAVAPVADLEQVGQG